MSASNLNRVYGKTKIISRTDLFTSLRCVPCLIESAFYSSNPKDKSRAQLNLKMNPLVVDLHSLDFILVGNEIILDFLADNGLSKLVLACDGEIKDLAGKDISILVDNGYHSFHFVYGVETGKNLSLHMRG